MWCYYIFFYPNISAITRYRFRYNFIKVFWVADIFRYSISITLLNGDLQEEIYMEQPLGFVAQGESSGMICHLCKSLYGLKQSPRAWFEKFSNVVQQFGMTRCEADHSIFY